MNTDPIEIPVRHGAPARARPRRGNGPGDIVAIPLVTTAAIPWAGSAETGMVKVRRGPDFVTEVEAVGGRLYRTVRSTAFGTDGPPLPLRDALAALTQAPSPFRPYDHRSQVREAFLDPWRLNDLIGRPAPLPVAPDGVVLDPAADLTDLARAGLVARVSARLRHHEGRLLCAIPHPTLSFRTWAAVTLDREADTIQHQTFPGCLPGEAEAYLRFVRHLRPDLCPETLDGFLGMAERLRESLGDVRPEPDEDVATFVRLQSLVLVEAARVMTRTAREAMADPRAVARLSSLRDLALRATADLIPHADLADAAETIHAAARTMIDIGGTPRSGPIVACRIAAAYVEEVARPRLAAANLPAEDADLLSGLTP